jgi:hypothetical protein
MKTLNLSVIRKMWELLGLSLSGVDDGEEIKEEICLLNGTLFRKWSETIKGIFNQSINQFICSENPYLEIPPPDIEQVSNYILI